MKTLFTSISILILICIQPLISHAYEGNNETASTKIIRMIDISNDSILCRILEDATDPVRFGNQRAYYTLSMEKYKDGTMIRIERSNSDIFEAREFPFAYTMVNNQLVVFTHTGGYQIHDARPKETSTIKIARKDEPSDITDILFYFMLGEVYAKFSPEAGWLWSDGKPDE